MQKQNEACGEQDGKNHEGPFCVNGAVLVKPNPATGNLPLPFPPVAETLGGRRKPPDWSFRVNPGPSTRVRGSIDSASPRSLWQLIASGKSGQSSYALLVRLSSHRKQEFSGIGTVLKLCELRSNAR